MNRYLQIDNGIVTGSVSTAGTFTNLPAGRVMLDVTDRPEAQVGMTYDAASDTFSPAPVIPKTRVSKSQVISVLTPQEWASANSSTEPEVVWGMAQFQLADVIDLADPRFASIVGGLIAKGIVTQARAAEITTALQALANA